MNNFGSLLCLYVGSSIGAYLFEEKNKYVIVYSLCVNYLFKAYIFLKLLLIYEVI